MVDQSAFEPYRRRAYLATVAEKDRATARRLCDLLEQAFPKKAIALYRGFPVVVRDGEWLAGFAMRKRAPMLYCCSPHTLKKMGKELKPLMSGKSCFELRAKGGLSLEDGFELVGRVFREAAKGSGMISATDRRKRDAGTKKRTAKKVAAKKKRTTKKKTTAKKKTAGPKTRTARSTSRKTKK
jgi:hypothetical protein